MANKKKGQGCDCGHFNGDGCTYYDGASEATEDSYCGVENEQAEDVCYEFTWESDEEE